MTNAALVSTSLDALTVRTPAGMQNWHAPTADAPSAHARALRDAATAAAEWTASLKPIKRRLNYVVVDVDESLLRWVHCPSFARPVVAATMRAQLAEWEGAAGGLIEPLSEPPTPAGKGRGKKGPADTEHEDEPAAAATAGSAQKKLGTPVIAVPDSLVRLWLDALDKRGVRVDTVISLWHAIAAAWTCDATEPTAVMLIEPGNRLTWAWTNGADLNAGGVMHLERPYPADDEPNPEHAEEAATRRAVKRLALEWLTWSAQTASLPERIILVGPNATEMARVVEAEWNGVRVTPHPCESPKQATLERLPAAPRAATESSRRALVGLTQRPTRATRRAYWLSGVALLLVGVAVAGLSRQMARQASQWADQRMEKERSAMEAIRSAQPSITAKTIDNARNDLRVILEDERNKERIELPRPPYDLFSEYARVLDVLTTFEPDKVTLVSIDLKEGKQSLLSLQVDDELTTGVSVAQRLDESKGKIDWEPSRRGNSARNFRLDGNWPLAVR